MDSLLTLLERPRQAFHLTCTTTAPGQTVTLQTITVKRPTRIVWGDGQQTAIAANTNTTLNHTYAASGAYGIVLYDAHALVSLDLRDAKLSGYNTRELRGCRQMHTFYLSGLGAGVINSAHMVGWGVSHTFYLYNLPSASITLDSAHMEGWGVSDMFYLHNLPSASITLDSAHMVGWGVSDRFSLYNLPSASITLSAADMLAWNSPDEIRINNCGLSAAAVTQAILGAWGIRNLMTHDTPILDIGGASNAVPGGAYAEENPPSTDLGYIYELVNDTEGEGFYPWAVVWNGGSAP